MIAILVMANPSTRNQLSHVCSIVLIDTNTLICHNICIDGERIGIDAVSPSTWLFMI